MNDISRVGTYDRPKNYLPYLFVMIYIFGNYIRYLISVQLPKPLLFPNTYLAGINGMFGDATEMFIYFDFLAPLMYIYAFIVVIVLISLFRNLIASHGQDGLDAPKDSTSLIITVLLISLISGYLLFIDPQLILGNPKLLYFPWWLLFLLVTLCFAILVNTAMQFWMDPGLFSKNSRRKEK